MRRQLHAELEGQRRPACLKGRPNRVTWEARSGEKQDKIQCVLSTSRKLAPLPSWLHSSDPGKEQQWSGSQTTPRGGGSQVRPHSAETKQLKSSARQRIAAGPHSLSAASSQGSLGGAQAFRLLGVF